MSHYISSIRKIGIINSGMFDTLNLNFDVAAVHLVGANNVGKTSLIALIQFLFFPSINEMTFIKSTGESMNFYFRPEGPTSFSRCAPSPAVFALWGLRHRGI
jgi:predicted ATP-binding protein involved in virulence